MTERRHYDITVGYCRPSDVTSGGRSSASRHSWLREPEPKESETVDKGGTAVQGSRETTANKEKPTN